MVLIRMNVAITRAKELLVVIGNGALLQRDPYWKSFLQFTFRNKLSVNSIRLGSFAFDPSDAKKMSFQSYVGPKLDLESDGNYISRLE